MIEKTLRDHAGRVDLSAAALGVERAFLFGRLKRLGIDRKRFVPPTVPVEDRGSVYNARHREKKDQQNREAARKRLPPLPGWGDGS